MSEAAFEARADEAVRLAVEAQLRAGVDVLTDGEQRRDGYASFVGARLDNCRLVPLTDLLPYVDDREAFRRELDSLDAPADRVRHPAVFGPLGRSRPLALHELDFVRGLSTRPAKVALPGPYVLTRMMWMEHVSDRPYRSRAELATDVVRVLREELAFLLAAGADLVQLDEPVLLGGTPGERGGTQEELAFALGLLEDLLAGLPRERLALHVCRGNWTTDESAAPSGDCGPLVPLLSAVPVGTLVLELCTPRAGDEGVLEGLPASKRVGVGVVNPKNPRVESVEGVLRLAERAIELFGPDRVLLNPDCGFATFADRPIAAAELAERKLAVTVEAARRLRAPHGLE